MVKSDGVSFTLHCNSQGRLPGSPLDQTAVAAGQPLGDSTPASNAAYRADRSRSRSQTTIRTAVAAEEQHSQNAASNSAFRTDRSRSRSPTTIRTAVAAIPAAYVAAFPDSVVAAEEQHSLEALRRSSRLTAWRQQLERDRPPTPQRSLTDHLRRSVRTPLTIRTAVAAEEQQSQTAVAAEKAQILTEVDSDSSSYVLSQAETLPEVEAPDEVIVQLIELF